MDIHERGRLRLRSPGDVAVAVPYLLGFVPEESLVVLPLEQGYPIMRLDLPAQRPALFAAAVQGMLRGVGISDAVLTLFTADAGLAARHGDALGRVLTKRSIHVREVIRVFAGRWWSLTCHEACCPDEGTPYDPDTTVVAAQATVAGLTVLPSRSAVEQVLAPLPDEGCLVARAMDAALAELHERLAATHPSAGTRWLDKDGRRRVREALAMFGSDGQESLTDDEIAWLVIHTRAIETRDFAWRLMRQGDIAHHRALWTYVARRVPPPNRPAVASLAGVAAYLSGSTVLARTAFEIALADEPDYSMALLFQELLDRVVPPSLVWSAV